MTNFKFISFYNRIMKVSFCGLKENIAYGKQAIAQIREDFPSGFISNTYYETFNKNPDKRTQEKYERAINETRKIMDWQLRLGKRKKEAAEIAVKQTGAANCGEQAFLVSKKLDEMGIKNKLVSMNVCSAKTKQIEDTHTFCIVDTDNPIDTYNPQAWSSDAVIVDMWSNTVDRAINALDYFCKLMISDEENQIVKFISVLD